MALPSPPVKKLIVTADDAGWSWTVNSGIQEARSQGIVTAVGLVPTGTAFQDAVDWVKSDPALGAGLHLDLERFFKVELAQPSPLWEFRDPRILAPEILGEMERQVRSLLAAGLRVRHISSRHHLHLRPELLPMVCDTAQKFGIPAVRFFPINDKFYPGVNLSWLRQIPARRGLAVVPYFIDGWYWGNVDERFGVAELSCRPSKEDDAGRRDLEACRSLRLREYLESQRIRLIAFDDFLKEFPPEPPPVPRPELIKTA
jgi:hypothetical protein